MIRSAAICHVIRVFTENIGITRMDMAIEILLHADFEIDSNQTNSDLRVNIPISHRFKASSKNDQTSDFFFLHVQTVVW